MEWTDDSTREGVDLTCRYPLLPHHLALRTPLLMVRIAWMAKIPARRIVAVLGLLFVIPRRVTNFTRSNRGQPVFMKQSTETIQDQAIASEISILRVSFLQRGCSFTSRELLDTARFGPLLHRSLRRVLLSRTGLSKIR